MSKYLFLIYFITTTGLAEPICNKDTLKYPENIPLDFRWHESDFTRESAKEAVNYFSKISEGDLSSYHWITSSHSENIIEGYTYKLLAVAEMNSEGAKSSYHVKNFCNWLSHAIQAD